MVTRKSSQQKSLLLGTRLPISLWACFTVVLYIMLSLLLHSGERCVREDFLVKEAVAIFKLECASHCLLSIVMHAPDFAEGHDRQLVLNPLIMSGLYCCTINHIYTELLKCCLSSYFCGEEVHRHCVSNLNCRNFCRGTFCQVFSWQTYCNDRF